jgi:hypothetical protein
MRSNSLSSVILAAALFFSSFGIASCNNNKSEAPSGDPSSDVSTSDANNPDAPLPPHESALPAGNIAYKRYTLKQGHIHYETSGFRRGVEDLYFTDYGRREARYVNIENLTEQGVRPEKMVVVTIGPEMRVANLTAGTGTRMREPVVDSLFRLTKVDPPGVISDSILSKMQYKKQGAGTLLGKPVTIWFEGSTGTTLYTWEGLVLKQDVKNPQHQHTVEAVSIDSSMPAPEIFRVPDTIKYVTVDPRGPRQ